MDVAERAQHGAAVDARQRHARQMDNVGAVQAYRAVIRPQVSAPCKSFGVRDRQV